MVEPVSIITALIAVGALILAAISRKKLNKVERQLDRKEDLSNIATSLKEIQLRLAEARDLLTNPLDPLYLDLSGQLRSCAKEIVALYHETGEEYRVYIHEFTRRGELEGREIISSTESAIDALEEDEQIGLLVAIEGGMDDKRVFAINEVFYQLRYLTTDLDSLTQDDRAIIDEFDPKLTSRLENSIRNLATRLAENILENSEGVVIEAGEYDTVDELAKDIHDAFLKYDSWEDDYENLGELLDRIGEVRKAMVQTSYS